MIQLYFGGKEFKITFQNSDELEFGEYKVNRASCDGVPLQILNGEQAVIPYKDLNAMGEGIHEITVDLASNCI